VKENSRAAVRSDPRTSQAEITVSAGTAELATTDGRQHVEIGRWERVTVPSSGGPVVKTNLLAPPDLAQPLNLQPLIVPDSKHTAVHFEWKVVPEAVNYELRVITAAQSQKRTIAPSDTFKFTLATQGKCQDMLLDIGGTEIHGNVVEISGHTEPGAALIINGESVADIRRDGAFKFFSQPLSRGSQTIVIMGQNRRGGTAIKRVEIVIP
jgi:hypothetical protein